MPSIDRNDVSELIARYTWAYDSFDRSELAEVFTAEAEYGVTLAGASLMDLHGRGPILEFVAGTRAQQLDQRRHVISNLQTLSRTDASVTVRAYLLLVTNGATAEDAFQTLGTGVYEFDIVHEDGELRFSRFVLALDRPLY